MQQDHPDQLPQVAMATLMSPGDRKFLDFINPFARFVASSLLKKEDDLFLEAHYLAKSKVDRSKVRLV